MSHMYHFSTFIFYVCKKQFNSTLFRSLNLLKPTGYVMHHQV